MRLRDKKTKKTKLKMGRTYIFAVAVGIVLAIFQWMNTYAISVMDGSFLFPVYSGGSIILSTLVGILFFKDKLTKSQKYSITLGIIAVIIMNV
jgi:multidrug transporter EmrE-like cation transporter